VADQLSQARTTVPPSGHETWAEDESFQPVPASLRGYIGHSPFVSRVPSRADSTAAQAAFGLAAGSWHDINALPAAETS
jgi:hypothetical protein